MFPALISFRDWNCSEVMPCCLRMSRERPLKRGEREHGAITNVFWTAHSSRGRIQMSHLTPKEGKQSRKRDGVDASTLRILILYMLYTGGFKSNTQRKRFIFRSINFNDISVSVYTFAIDISSHCLLFDPQTLGPSRLKSRVKTK